MVTLTTPSHWYQLSKHCTLYILYTTCALRKHKFASSLWKIVQRQWLYVGPIIPLMFSASNYYILIIWIPFPKSNNLFTIRNNAQVVNSVALYIISLGSVLVGLLKMETAWTKYCAQCFAFVAVANPEDICLRIKNIRKLFMKKLQTAWTWRNGVK